MLSDDVLAEIKNDVKEVKSLVIDLVKQGAIHNQILDQHEKRSTQLETRLAPIEADYSFRHRLFSVCLSALTLISGLLALFKFFR